MNGCSLLILTLLISSAESHAADVVLTKKDAFELMKRNGFKWKQTELLTAQAAAEKIQAKSYILPHISGFSREQGGNINQLELGYSVPNNLGYYTVGITAVEASFSLYDRTATERLNAAVQNEHLSEAMREQYQLDLTYVMFAQYLNTQRLKQKLSIIDTNIARDKTILDAAKAKVASGLGLRIDLMRAQGLLEFENLKRLDTETSYKKARQELAILLGSGDFAGELPPWEVTKIKEPGRLDTTNRAEVRAANNTIQVAHSLLEEAKGASYPKLSIFGDFGIVGTHVIGGFGNAASGSMGVQVTLALFEGNLLTGLEQEASVKLTQVSLQAQQINLEVSSKANEAKDQLINASEALEVSDRQTSLANEELRLAQQRFSSGVSAGLELSSAQKSVSAAHDLQLDAQFGYEMAKLNFYRAAGDFNPYLLESGLTR